MNPFTLPTRVSPTALAAFNASVTTARDAYRSENACHCGALVPFAPRKRARLCDQCRRERKAERDRKS